MRHVIVLSLLLFVAGAAFGVQFPALATQPPHPIAGSNVTVLVGWLCPTYNFKQVSGNVIELTTESSVCLSANIPGQQPFNVGPLAAGTYEVRVIDQDNFLVGSFEVAALPADVPALDSRALWVLAAAIGALGVFGIGRGTS